MRMHMHDSLVSVIIPTYNRQDVICRAIDSVLAQTYKNIEVIVVDDGSNDTTAAHLRKYNNNEISVITQTNKGPSAARNRGVVEAKGEFLAFLDADDLWYAEKLERQVGLLEKVGPDVSCCLCNAVIRGESVRDITSFHLAPLEISYSEGLWTNVTEVLATRGVVFTQALVVRKEIFNEVGGFDEDLRLMEDWDLSLRLSEISPWAYIREPLVIYHRGRKDSLSFFARSNEGDLQRSIRYICAKMLSKNLLPLEVRRDLLRKGRNAQCKLILADVDKFWRPQAIKAQIRLLIYAARLILFRRIYNVIPGLLPSVIDVPICQ